MIVFVSFPLISIFVCRFLRSKGCSFSMDVSFLFFFFTLPFFVVTSSGKPAKSSILILPDIYSNHALHGCLSAKLWIFSSYSLSFFAAVPASGAFRPATRKDPLLLQSTWYFRSLSASIAAAWFS